MRKFILLLVTGIWIGLVIGISFMEAPLKFQAPGITLELGLGIGSLVFGTLNKIELVLMLVMLIAISKIYKQLGNLIFGLIATLTLILLVQTFILFPILDARIVMIQSGEEPPPSSVHLIYIVMEVIKLMTLFVLFYKSYFRQLTKV